MPTGSLSLPRLSRPTRLVLVVVLAASLVVGSAGLAGALTSWRTFSSGYTVARGNDGIAPEVMLTSTTNANPERIRYTITNRAGSSRSVRVWWYLDCWREGTYGPVGLTYKSGSFTKRLSGGTTLRKEISFNGNAKYCTLHVSTDYASRDWGNNGRLDLKLQGRY